MEKAQLDLKRTKILAPIDGVIVEEMVEQLFAEGETAKAETHQALTATLSSLGEAASRIGVGW